MARIEKTVFISYRRKDISWALAVYQYLTGQKYDVFFDYTSIPSGDFEQIIVSNIKARAHFILILTPTALDRCSEPGDWLRREIETAVDEKRNIIPLFFDGFSFGSPAVKEKLTGKLSTINRYNGLDIPSGYFVEAMERLSDRYLNVPLDAVLHPVPTEVRKVVKEEQVAADKALIQKRADIEELIKPVEEKLNEVKLGWDKQTNLRRYGIGAGILVIALLGIFGVNSLIQNLEGEAPTPTQTREFVVEATKTPTQPILTNTATISPFTPTSELSIGLTMVGKDGMTLLYVPAGEFTMGSEDGDPDERPIRTVSLDAFWIDRTEVTNAMFVNFLNSEISQISTRDSEHVILSGNEVLDLVCTTCPWIGAIRWDGNRFSVFADFTEYPVTLVSWYGADAYCSWTNRRLPTEAEWEKAARGENAFIYPWGNDAPNANLLNHDNTVGNVKKVGSYTNGASPYGVLDMAGNVWEWVGDWYEAYPGNTVSDPKYGTGLRVLRGGSWNGADTSVYAANRNSNDPSYTPNNVGFRCAMSASE